MHTTASETVSLVEVSSSSLGAEIFLERERHALDVVAIPHGLKHGVGEPEDEEVLRHLLAQIVVDAVHVGLVEVFA